MSETDQHPDSYEEPAPLSSVLLDYDVRGPGRPKKGEEKKHGVDQQYIDVQAEMVADGITPLAGQDERGAVRIDKESARHRVLVYLFAQGGTVRSVFESLGGQYGPDNKPLSGTGEYSYSHLVQLRRQPFFQQQLLEVIAENGSPLIEARLKLEQMASLETLIEIRDNVQEKGATRASAANSILDRFLGKPTQTIRTEAPATTERHEDEVDTLQEKLKRLQIEAANLNAAFDKPTV